MTQAARRYVKMHKYRLHIVFTLLFVLLVLLVLVDLKHSIVIFMQWLQLTTASEQLFSTLWRV